LTSWAKLGTASPLGGGVFEFIDTTAPGIPSRFYQIRTP
jgi:hypothetical protein